MLRYLFLAGSVGLLGCGDNGGKAVDANTPDMMVDAPMIDTPRMETWGTPAIVTITPGVGIDDDPSMTNDLLDLFFNRDGDIYIAHRNTPTSAFGAPAKITEVSGVTSYETGPHITGDGLTLIFASDRGGSGQDIYIATRVNRTTPFGVPTAVTALNSTTDDAGPSITDDGLVAVVSSIRLGGNPELFIASRTSATGTFGTPTALTELNTTAVENSPQLSPDKLTAYWDANPGSSNDLYFATRTSATGTFSAPMPIAELNTTSEEGDVWVSADGRHMIFVSNRSGNYAFYEAAR